MTAVNETDKQRRDRQRKSAPPTYRRRCLRCGNFFDCESGPDLGSRYRFYCNLCNALEKWRGADLEREP
jgi:hypothetical protein